MITITYNYDDGTATTVSFKEDALVGVRHQQIDKRHYYDVLYGEKRSAQCTEDVYYRMLNLLKEARNE